MTNNQQIKEKVFRRMTTNVPRPLNEITLLDIAIDLALKLKDEEISNKHLKTVTYGQYTENQKPKDAMFSEGFLQGKKSSAEEIFEEIEDIDLGYETDRILIDKRNVS